MSKKIASIFLSLAIASTVFLTGCSPSGVLDPKNPVTITIWHYYNGSQQQAFDTMVESFNQTVGKEKGIIVTSFSQGGVKDLTDKIVAAANKDVGAENMPDIFAAYADTAYEIDKMGIVADISQYITQKELDEYVDSYIEEGRFTSDGSIKIFPIAKSTEVLMLNETQWNLFKTATGVSEADLTTWESVTEVSKKYYQWTDSLTPDKNDGKAFIGRDAVANYFLVGSMQLGTEIFDYSDIAMKFVLDPTVMKKLWDNFYVPYVNGYSGAFGRFRSDDVKTGQLIACIGSTSSASYFPKEVTYEDGSKTAIQRKVLPLPNFAGTKPMAVQQGAGMVVCKSVKEKEHASVEFLKWFTDKKQNTEFALMSGYIPVKKSARTKEAFAAAADNMPDALNSFTRDTISVSLDMSQNYTFYTSKASDNGYNARDILETSMASLAKENLAKVQELVNSGVSRSDAAAQFTTQENFDDWLKSITTKFSELQ